MLERIGNYRVVAQIGEGGMGRVYAALAPDGSHVAIKLLHPALASDDTARARLEREAATINRVTGPGIARVVDVETRGDRPFVVTEYVEGPTLAEDVRERGPWNREDLGDLATRLAELFARMHACGIIHRDIKPSNIMLSKDGPVLIDFGISQALEDERLTSTGLITGTPGYVAPELIEGEAPNEASDWWAWAAVLVYCATGRPPFGSAGLEATLARVSRGNPDVEGLDAQLAEALRAGLRADARMRAQPDHVCAVIRGEVSGEEATRLLSVEDFAPTSVMSTSEAAATEAIAQPTQRLAPLHPPSPGVAPTVAAPIPYPRVEAAPATRVLGAQVEGETQQAQAHPNPLLGVDTWSEAPRHEEAPQETSRHAWVVPYHPALPVVTWHVTLPVLVALAALTVNVGTTPIIVGAVAYVVAGVGGRLYERVTAERVRRGYAESGDVTRSLIGLPVALLRTLVAAAASALLCGGLAWAGWYAIQVAYRGWDSPWSLHQAVTFASQIEPRERAWLTGVIFAACALAWILPWSRTTRRGYGALMTHAASSWWVRLLIAVVCASGALVALARADVLTYLSDLVSRVGTPA